MEYKIVNCPHCGKILSQHILSGEIARVSVTCPICGSQKNYKAGLRYTGEEKIQRFLCRACGYRFSIK